MSNTRSNRPKNKLLYLPEHQPLFGTMQFVSKQNLNPGDVITFNYKGKEPGDTTEVRWVFVLDPNYTGEDHFRQETSERTSKLVDGKLHGLTLGMTPKQELIRHVIDPMYDTDIPFDLYYSDIFKIARDWDSYRTYFVKNMNNVRRFPYFLTSKPVFKDGKRIR